MLNPSPRIVHNCVLFGLLFPDTSKTLLSLFKTLSVHSLVGVSVQYSLLKEFTATQLSQHANGESTWRTAQPYQLLTSVMVLSSCCSSCPTTGTSLHASIINNSNSGTRKTPHACCVTSGWPSVSCMSRTRH